MATQIKVSIIALNQIYIIHTSLCPSAMFKTSIEFTPSVSEVEPPEGIEPTPIVYKTTALPLSYGGVVPREGFEPPKA